MALLFLNHNHLIFIHYRTIIHFKNKRLVLIYSQKYEFTRLNNANIQMRFGMTQDIIKISNSDSNERNPKKIESW